MNNAHKLGAVIILRAFKALHRAVQRGQRVFQFMRHIGGKAVNRVDTQQ